LIGDFNESTSVEKDYFLFDEKDETNTFSDLIENKLPNSEQSNKGKVKTHKYINRQNQSTTGKL
jgi:hypothetical protein